MANENLKDVLANEQAEEMKDQDLADVAGGVADKGEEDRICILIYSDANMA